METSGISAAGRAELSAVLSGRRFIRPVDVVQALDIGADDAAKKLSRWAAQGWLRRVRRALYIAVPVDAAHPGSWAEDPLVVAAEVWPCYFTGWTAANEWALSDQVFRTTIVRTTSRVRTSRVRLLDHDYLVSSTSDADMTWGMRSQWKQESRLRFADPARTVVDILDAPWLAGGMRHGSEILAAYVDDYDAGTLIDYGDRLGNGSLFKRLGYCIEAMGRDLPEVLAACRDRVPAGVTALDPAGPRGGRNSARWGLRINITVGTEEPA